MHVTAFVREANHVCCRYRLTAFRTLLAASGHDLQIRTWPRQPGGWLTLAGTVAGTEAIIIQRKLLARWQLFLLRRAGRVLIFDFDDAVFLRDSHAAKGPHCPKRLRRFITTMRHVDAVAAGNSFLAEHASQFTRATVQIIPTCIDPLRYSTRTHKASPHHGITLCWIGSASTIKSLETLKPALEELGKRLPGLRLKLIADRFFDLSHVEVVPCPWSPMSEAAEIAECDIGINWLPDDLWSRGKCGLKNLQYMAAGLPVVANDVGVHAEMIRHGGGGFLVNSPAEFIDAIVRLAGDAELRQRFGRAGRCRVEQHYSISSGASAWRRLLDEFVNQGRSRPPSARESEVYR